MTIDEAIEILSTIRHTGHYQPTRDDVKAVQLGIEALKEIHRERIGEIPFIGDKLPGETEE